MKTNRSSWFLVLSLLVLFPNVAIPWGDVGHQVVAQIAWNQFKKSDQEKLTQILQPMVSNYSECSHFITASVWADHIKTNNWKLFSHWHYIDFPYVTGPLRKVPKVPKENAVQGMCEAIKTLQTSTDPLGKAMMLALLIHIVGDVHQPLHAISHYSSKFPKGDSGGFLYKVQTETGSMNLHLYWDLGAGLLEKPRHPYTPLLIISPQTENLAKAWSEEFPKDKFKKQLQETQLISWAKESYELAKQVAYPKNSKTVHSKEYVLAAQPVVKKQITLAGYRLAQLLEQVLDEKKGLKLGCR